MSSNRPEERYPSSGDHRPTTPRILAAYAEAEEATAPALTALGAFAPETSRQQPREHVWVQVPAKQPREAHHDAADRRNEGSDIKPPLMRQRGKGQ